MRPSLIALTICAGTAILEGAMAGKNVRARFSELRLPPFSPPLAAWFAIGLVFYAVCFVILVRLLQAGPAMPRHRLALGMLGGVMVANATWGLLFFRLKNLRASYRAFLPYCILVLGLLALLTRIDVVSALVLLPYVLYLAYAIWWARALWRLSEIPRT